MMELYKGRGVQVVLLADGVVYTTAYGRRVHMTRPDETVAEMLEHTERALVLHSAALWNASDEAEADGNLFKAHILDNERKDVFRAAETLQSHLYHLYTKEHVASTWDKALQQTAKSIRLWIL